MAGDSDESTTAVHPLTGRLDERVVHELPVRAPAEIIEGFRALRDATGTVSDALDDLGVTGCVGSSILIPSMPAECMVGTAVTVRNIGRAGAPVEYASRRDVRMEELEGINQGEPGDVLVISGLSGVSNMGGMMATIAKRQGLTGAVIDGGVRDLGQARRIDFPVWSRDVTPVTGKWRAETVEINGDIDVCGVRVCAGDLVIADETGVCFIPLALAGAVLERARASVEKEGRYHADIAAGMIVPALAAKYKPPRA